MDTPKLTVAGVPARMVGYAWAGCIGQNLDAQLELLQKAGCGKIFADERVRSRLERPELERMMAYLRPGDVLVVTELSRVTRSLPGLLEIAMLLEQRQLNLVSLREKIDTANAAGRNFLSAVQAMREMEKTLKAERAAAKVRGKTGGRPRTDLRRLEDARILYEKSGKTADEVCQIIGIGRRTFFTHLSLQRCRRKPSRAA